jgi:dihydroorotate dehydrogenase
LRNKHKTEAVATTAPDRSSVVEVGEDVAASMKVEEEEEAEDVAASMKEDSELEDLREMNRRSPNGFLLPDPLPKGELLRDTLGQVTEAASLDLERLIVSQNILL